MIIIDYMRIGDKATREAVRNMEERLVRIESIPQLSADTSLTRVIEVINTITDSVKKRR
jgi:hypothetical protein